MKTESSSSGDLTRRQFLVLGGTAAVLLSLAPITGCGGGSGGSAGDQGLFVYRLSSRGKRASRASKKHNANMLFATWEAADAHRAHPGDRSRIVQVNLSTLSYERLFRIPGRQAVDLRKL